MAKKVTRQELADSLEAIDDTARQLSSEARASGNTAIADAFDELISEDEEQIAEWRGQ